MTKHFHHLSSTPGLQTLENQSCTLLGFALINLGKGQHIQGDVAKDREILLVVLSGKARIHVNGHEFSIVGARPNVFTQSPHSVYLPAGAHYQIEALTNFEAALPSAPSTLNIEPYEICPEQVKTGTWGTLNYSRNFREILVEADGRPASSLIVGETLTPSGNWSTYPPHKHEQFDGTEVMHEEMYYFRISTPEGFGLLRHYGSANEFDDTHTVRDNTLISLPYGYHTYVGAPGAQSYYLWFLAGDTRRQGVKSDPALAWTQKVVGMI